jgi:mannose-6-phosphate isomerase-like protein (cupin superfamily)
VTWQSRLGPLSLSQGDSIQVEQIAGTLQGGDADSLLIVAGVSSAIGKQPDQALHGSASHYRVTKPWGHELWLTGEHPKYCLKELFVKPGGRLSLQYHRIKEETLVLVEGRTRLVYKAAPLVTNDAVRPEHLGSVTLEAITRLHVPPLTLHRYEAETATWLYEVSTPHLDDVIRVQDDTGRQSGRVATEHGNG